MQVDIFSLGVIMYETFLMCPMVEKVSKSGTPDEFEVYAKLVSMGQRQPLKSSWPAALQVTICSLFCFPIDALLRDTVALSMSHHTSRL